MVEKSKATIEFPCAYPLKVIGIGGEDLQRSVAEVVRQYVPELEESMIRSRASQGGNYLAVTVTFIARDRGQLEAIYQDLSRDPRVVLTL